MSPLVDQLRRRRIGDIVDAEAAANFARAGFAELLMVDDHDVVRDPHLVRVPAFGHIDLADDLRLARIGDVKDGRAAGRPHVADIERRAVDPDLAAARTIDMR